MKRNSAHQLLQIVLGFKIQDFLLSNCLWQILIAVVCLAPTTNALEFKVIGPCDQRPKLSVSVDIKNKITIGDLTVKLLTEKKLPYKGDASGIAQIENSPIGQESVEILSSTSYRAYGWCFHVDGFEPAEMPDKVDINQSTKEIIWFYAYSLFDNGVWKDYCTPSWSLRSLPICRN